MFDRTVWRKKLRVSFHGEIYYCNYNPVELDLVPPGVFRWHNGDAAGVPELLGLGPCWWTDDPHEVRPLLEFARPEDAETIEERCRAKVELGLYDLVRLDEQFVIRVAASFADIPKQAGFRYRRHPLPSGPARVWVTKSAMAAERLSHFASTELSRAIRETAAEEKAQLEARFALSQSSHSDLQVPAPTDLEYYGFQRAGIEYTLMTASTLIADEMGLGKTIQAVGVLNSLPDIKSCLIVCPNSLKLNWKRELKKWLVRPLTIGVAESSAHRLAPPSADVLIVNYEQLRRRHEASQKSWQRVFSHDWDLLICDEAHHIKNHMTASYEAVSKLQTKRKILLTGTPIIKGLDDIFTLAHLLRPDVFSKRAHFLRDYGAAIHDQTVADRLYHHLRSTLMVRRTKDAVLSELPPKRRQIIEISSPAVVKAEEEELQLLREHLASALMEVELAKCKGVNDYATAVSALTKARFESNQKLSEIRQKTALKKLKYVIEHLEESLVGGSAVVCFAHHRRVVDAIQAHFGKRSVRVYGGDSADFRQDAVDRFQRGDVKLFVGSIRAVGEGITLTASSHVVFAELDWTSAAMVGSARSTVSLFNILS